ncbi:PilW family protein [Demequina lignilytica]|uniref:Prepilin-type N-terminal cleavage/methylation domain-containing protein n=1 Tax=Demequina lignilytica TaxID=3051663 RepID=A0AB35ME54_9MICO|nr:prepilin-type N-terminal cleavage/methylation domain-containing protein [Demequina sp. SYSU T0a273]MDN4482052.1 prepilin-type N-terminal cleavage/methylation domain-containing protein [Demequina sp. SYSU T0a273]
MNRFANRAGGDSGFTLVELIVYMVVLVIVTLMAGTIFINIVFHERYARATAEANNEAQTVFKELEYDLRSADWADVSSNGDLVVILTRKASISGGNEARCVGYYYDEPSGELRRTTRTDNLDTSPAISATTEAALVAATDTWPLVRTDMQTIDGAPVFGLDDKYGAGMAVTIQLRAEAFEDRAPIDFVKSIALRKQADLTLSCK